MPAKDATGSDVASEDERTPAAIQKPPVPRGTERIDVDVGVIVFSICAPPTKTTREYCSQYDPFESSVARNYELTFSTCAVALARSDSNRRRAVGRWSCVSVVLKAGVHDAITIAGLKYDRFGCCPVPLFMLFLGALIPANIAVR